MIDQLQPNPFAGMDGITGEAVQSEGFLKIAILGKPKTGKSWFAATAPAPIRYYDFDKRKESLEGKAGLFIKSGPTMLDVETDLSIMKAAVIKAKQTNFQVTLPKTVVFDSVTFMKRAMEEELFRQDPGLARSIKVGNATSMKIGKSWDVVNAIQRYVEYLIAEFSGLGINIVFVFHEKDEKDRVDSTTTETKYTGLVTTDPQYLQNSLSLFNEVYRITVDGNRNYIVTCRPNWDVNASTTMMLDATEKPDIMAMIKKHQEKRKQIVKV